MEDKRTFLEDLSEEELEKIWADPEFQKRLKQSIEDGKQRQAKLRKQSEIPEQNSKASEKNT